MINKKKLLSLVFVVLIPIIALASLFLAANFEDDRGISHVRISNLSSNSVSISWLTEKSTKGEIIYSTQNDFPNAFEKMFLDADDVQISFDDRNLSRNDDENSTSVGEYFFDSKIAKDRTIHHVTLRNLDPDKEYFFRINGNLTQFAGKNEVGNGVISFKTLENTASVSQPNPVYGQIVNYVSEEPNPIDGVVYYSIVNKMDLENRSAVYSSLISTDSGWSGNLSGILGIDGEVFQWNSNEYMLHTDILSDVGSGYNRLELTETKPVRDSIVNVRYISQQ